MTDPFCVTLVIPTWIGWMVAVMFGGSAVLTVIDIHVKWQIKRLTQRLDRLKGDKTDD